MTDTPLGKKTSLWIDTTEQTTYPALPPEGNRTYDAIVMGGGITGIMTAWRLQLAGVRTALLEKDRIVEYTTGNTTAKLTSQHYLVYKELTDRYGKDVAQAFATANQGAIDEIADISQRLDIACDFEWRDAFVYTQRTDKVGDIEAEVAASQKLGLPSSFETTTELPYDIKAAIRFTHQAQFHPRKFLLGMARDFVSHGGEIYEHTEAKEVRSDDGYTVVTDKGEVSAPYLIDATKESFWQGKLFEKATWIKISYALGLKIRGDYPRGMYITTDDPMRSIRSHPYEDGEILLFGGDSHKLTDEWDEDLHYNNLLEDARARYVVEKAVYRWLAGDVMPYDYLPYIGEYPGYPRAYTATGYRAWGLAWGVAASNIITDSIVKQPPAWAQPFMLTRLER